LERKQRREMGRNSDEGDEEDRVLGRGMTSDNLQADEKTEEELRNALKRSRITENEGKTLKEELSIDAIGTECVRSPNDPQGRGENKRWKGRRQETLVMTKERKKKRTRLLRKNEGGE